MNSLSKFHNEPFINALKAFFEELKVPVNYVADEPTTAKEILTDTYKENESFQRIDDVYFVGIVDDAAFEGNKSLDAETIKSDYDGILIFGVRLKERPNRLLPGASGKCNWHTLLRYEWHTLLRYEWHNLLRYEWHTLLRYEWHNLLRYEWHTLLRYEWHNLLRYEWHNLLRYEWHTLLRYEWHTFTGTGGTFCSGLSALHHKKSTHPISAMRATLNPMKELQRYKMKLRLSRGI